MKTGNCASIALCAMALALGEPASAQSTPPDLRDLVGARAAGGEAQMERRGYTYVSTQTGSDRKWTYWWHDRRNACVTVATFDGRYASITSTLPADCGRAGAGNAPPADRQSIRLTCFGEGHRPQVRTIPTLRWDRREHEFDRDYVNIMSRREFDTMVQVDIHRNQGYIWLPKALIPPIHSGSDHGWWKLDNLVVTGRSITGRYRLNGLNRPTVTIDRGRERIRIKGQRDFRGTCEPSGG